MKTSPDLSILAPDDLIKRLRQKDKIIALLVLSIIFSLITGLSVGFAIGFSSGWTSAQIQRAK
jgi:NhaP-type Na+/H+ or K+/H+ antiporter